MKRSTRHLIRMAVACFLLSAAGWPAAGDTIYNTGFESPTYSTGALVGQDSWLGSGPSGDEPGVQSSVFHGGSQAAAALRLGANLTTSIEAYRDFGLASGIVRVQTAIRIEDMVSSGDNWDAFTVYRDAYGGGGNRATILYFRPVDSNGGNIRVFNGGSEQTVDAWTDDIWYDLVFTFDVPNQTFDLSINGLQVANDYSFLDSGATAIGGVYYQEYGGLQGGGMYFDDLSVEIIPEPYSALLLALAGLGLFLARARRRTRP